MSFRRTRTACRPTQLVELPDLRPLGKMEGYRPEPVLGEKRPPHRRRRKLQNVPLDLGMKFQQVEEVRHANPADAQFARELGLAQSGGAPEPAAVL